MITMKRCIPQTPKCTLQFPVLKNKEGRKIFTCIYCGEERGIEEFGRKVCPIVLKK